MKKIEAFTTPSRPHFTDLIAGPKAATGGGGGGGGGGLVISESVSESSLGGTFLFLDGRNHAFLGAPSGEELLLSSSRLLFSVPPFDDPSGGNPPEHSTI